jgi:hypothetical protein
LVFKYKCTDTRVNVGEILARLLRDYLTKLLDFKIGEDSDTIYLRPFVVLKVEYEDTYEGEKPVRELINGKLVTVGKVDYFSLKPIQGFQFNWFPDTKPDVTCFYFRLLC